MVSYNAIVSWNCAQILIGGSEWRTEAYLISSIYAVFGSKQRGDAFKFTPTVPSGRIEPFRRSVLLTHHQLEKQIEQSLAFRLLLLELYLYLNVGEVSRNVEAGWRRVGEGWRQV